MACDASKGIPRAHLVAVGAGGGCPLLLPGNQQLVSYQQSLGINIRVEALQAFHRYVELPGNITEGVAGLDGSPRTGFGLTLRIFVRAAVRRAGTASQGSQKAAADKGTDQSW